MIKGIIELLNTGDHFGISDRVEIAKGKHKLPTTWRDSVGFVVPIPTDPPI